MFPVFNMLCSEDDFFIISCGWFILHCLQKKMKKRRQHRYWVRSLLTRRENNGAAEMLTQLKADDFGLHGELRSSFHNFVRMSSTDFENLINLIGAKIYKQNTNYRDAISVNDRLAITLRFLATGDSYQSLMYLCKVSASSISRIVPEVCSALCEGLHDYIKVRTYIQNNATTTLLR